MSRYNSILKTHDWLGKSPLYLDTETTGLENYDEVIEIAIIDDDGSSLVNSLIKPIHATVSPGAQSVHHITDAMLETAPTLAQLWPQIVAATMGRTVLIYNKVYDMGRLRRSLIVNEIRIETPFISHCVMECYAEYYGDWNDYYQSYRLQKLDAAALQCGITTKQDHRALGDCQITRLIVHHMAENDEYSF